MQNFNYHSHTYRCGHAQFDYLDEEYVLDYIANGFKKIAFTDHAPEKNIIDKRNHMRMGYEQRHEYYASIDKLKEKYADKIEIQKGFEIEFLPNDIQNMLELKAETDILILGQHFVYDDSGKGLRIFWEKLYCTDSELIRYAEYLEEAMKLGIPNIIAHPDICYSSREHFGELEEKVARRICEAAQKYQIPLEINLNGVASKTYLKDKQLNEEPFEVQVSRLKDVRYPCTEFWNIVKEYDVKVLYGLDTHCRNYICNWKNLVKLANIKIGEDTISKLNFLEDF